MSKISGALFLVCSGLSGGALAQTHTLTLTEQQIEGIIQAGAACLEKTPYACAEYTIYIRNLLQAAKQPKPEPKKE